MVDKLKSFDYRHFTDKFLDSLKDELPKLVAAAKKDHDLERMKPSERYKTRLQKRIKRLDKEESDMHWKDDSAEYAERIWQWWKPRRPHLKKSYGSTARCAVDYIQLHR